jgi:hypothetical protein
VGPLECRRCHREAYAFWESTRHAHAFQALEDKGKQYHLDCVGCHVTGWQRPGGVCRVDALENRTNVTCESCHGPGSTHVVDRSSDSILSGRRAKTCTGCHDPDNSPHFARDLYLPRILGPGHGEPMPEGEVKDGG